jgi:hypothetical protein
MNNRSTLAEKTPHPKVVSLDAARRLRALSDSDEELSYQARVLGMDKLALLEEMVSFQQERSRRGELTIEMMARGKHLFKALEERAETRELQLLAKSYRRHLEHEMSQRLQQG